MSQRRLTHTIRAIEQICRGCWEVRTQTEDGHRFTAFGVTRQQALYRAHQKAKAYGRYAYPTMTGAASDDLRSPASPAPDTHHRRRRAG